MRGPLRAGPGAGETAPDEDDAMEARQKQLHIFRTDARCSVLVMSLKTGSHGLNLTCASNGERSLPSTLYPQPSFDAVADATVAAKSHPLRAVVEPHARAAGHGQGAQNRSDEAGHGERSLPSTLYFDAVADATVAANRSSK